MNNRQYFHHHTLSKFEMNKKKSLYNRWPWADIDRDVDFLEPSAFCFLQYA